MQIHMQFTGTIDLPVAYRSIVHGMVYKLLSSQHFYSAELHSSIAEERAYKYFTFGPLTGKYEYKNGFIQFHNPTLEVRCMEEEMAQILFDAISQCDLIMLGHNKTNAKISLTSRIINEEHCLIRMISPVVAYATETDGHTTFFTPHENIFYRMIEHNAIRKYEYYYNKPADTIKIEPSFDILPRKEATHFKTTFITGWYGIYSLKCSQQMINFLYQVGLGTKNSEGFGMFEIYRRSIERKL